MERHELWPFRFLDTVLREGQQPSIHRGLLGGEKLEWWTVVGPAEGRLGKSGGSVLRGVEPC